MKPSISDFQYLQCRAPRPSWASPAWGSDPIACLHSAINRRGGLSYFVETRNACAILSMVRKRGENLEAHLRWAVMAYRKIQPVRSQTYARFLRRMMHSHNARVVACEASP